MLNSFLRELAKYDFFVNSLEFAIFANYTSERLVVEKKKIPQLSAVERLKKY